MANYQWVDLLGEFQSIDGGRVYKGREYEDPIKSALSNEQGEWQSQPTQLPSSQAIKKVWIGQSLCDQRFKDGTIKVEIEFEDFDLRCMADVILQYDPNTQDMLTLSLGGDVPEAPGVNLYALRLFATQQLATEQNIGTTGGALPKKWKTLRHGGERQNLKAGRRYPIEVSVRGLAIRVQLNDVEIVRHTLPFALPGLQVGLFCAGPKNIYFRDFQVDVERPQAFIVMQFDTPEYEALFNEVIKPICEKEGLRVYRADFAKQPGLIISDIAKQITESQVIIAEVTPINGNVYYEVGYADALKKPVVLIANRAVGQLPFDVRPYRTIFYENSIGGKRTVEETLGEYLKNILTPQSF
jgi:nucleoside 2-deoxyribosyltransferase